MRKHSKPTQLSFLDAEGLPNQKRNQNRHDVTGRWVAGQGRKTERTCPRCGKKTLKYTSIKGQYCSQTCYYSRTTIEEKLWPRLVIAENGCWNWTGGKDWDGYGALRWGKEQRAHRVAYILTMGPIPEDMWVLHRCDNPSCCNPFHLFLGDADDNNKDMMRKGHNRVAFGENHTASKLTNEQIIEIRRLHSEGNTTQREIAKRFCVGFKAINKIVLGQRWKHLLPKAIAS